MRWPKWLRLLVAEQCEFRDEELEVHRAIRNRALKQAAEIVRHQACKETGIPKLRNLLADRILDLMEN